jgi:hypothetical protein
MAGMVGDNASVDGTTQCKNPKDNTQIEDRPLALTASKNEKDTDIDEPKYITGFALYSVLSAVTLVCFLMFLDLSIVATVRSKHYYSVMLLTVCRPFLELLVTSIP